MIEVHALRLRVGRLMGAWLQGLGQGSQAGRGRVWWSCAGTEYVTQVGVGLFDSALVGSSFALRYDLANPNNR